MVSGARSEVQDVLVLDRDILWDIKGSVIDVLGLGVELAKLKAVVLLKYGAGRTRCCTELEGSPEGG
jgi:hypothetical protein